MKNENFLQDKIKNVNPHEVKELFQTEFEVDIDCYQNYEIQYRNFENDNYKVQSEVDSYGGEGQGEKRWNVSRILDKRTNEVFFIRFNGFYTSWDGTDWSENSWSIVVPKEVKVVQWC